MPPCAAAQLLCTVLHRKRRNKRSVAAEHCFNCKNSPLPAEAWYNELIGQVAYLELDQELSFAAFPESEVKPQVRPIHNHEYVYGSFGAY